MPTALKPALWQLFQLTGISSHQNLWVHSRSSRTLIWTTRTSTPAHIVRLSQSLQRMVISYLAWYTQHQSQISSKPSRSGHTSSRTEGSSFTRTLMQPPRFGVMTTKAPAEIPHRTYGYKQACRCKHWKLYTYISEIRPIWQHCCQELSRPHSSKPFGRAETQTIVCFRWLYSLGSKIDSFLFWHYIPLQNEMQIYHNPRQHFEIYTHFQSAQNTYKLTIDECNRNRKIKTFSR